VKSDFINRPSKKQLIIPIIVFLFLIGFGGAYVYKMKKLPTSTPNSASDSTATTDTCNVAIGNGNEVIAGPSGPQESDYDQVFRSLTVDPSNPDIVILGTERNGFLKSTDGGNTWSRLRQGLRHENIGYPEIWNLAIAPTSASTLLAATLDSPGPITEMGGVYKSTDGGETWSRSNCGLPSSRITSIAFASDSSNNAVAGVEGGASSKSGNKGQYYDGGIYYSIDGGSNWSKANMPGKYTKNGYWNLIQRNNTFFTFGFNYYDSSENIGFIKSDDNGKNWSATGDELKNQLITGFDVSSDGQTIYANARDSFKINKSINGGTSWTTISNGANGPVAVSPSNANLVVYAGSETLFRTTDGMTDSTPVLESSKQFDDIAFAPSNNSIVYAITTGYLLYKSSDSGATWTQIKNLRSDVLN